MHHARHTFLSVQGYRPQVLDCILCRPVSAFQVVAALARSPHPRYSLGIFLFWLHFVNLCRPHVNGNSPRSLYSGTEAYFGTVPCIRTDSSCELQDFRPYWLRTGAYLLRVLKYPIRLFARGRLSFWVPEQANLRLESLAAQSQYPPSSSSFELMQLNQTFSSVSLTPSTFLPGTLPRAADPLSVR